jgi:hypothetical protein
MKLCVYGSVRWPEHKSNEVVKAVRLATNELDTNEDAVDTLIISGAQAGVDKVIRECFPYYGYEVVEVPYGSYNYKDPSRQSREMVEMADAVLVIAHTGGMNKNSIMVHAVKTNKPLYVYKSGMLYTRKEEGYILTVSETACVE